MSDPKELVSRPHNFAAMMVQYGQADGIVSGNQSHPSAIARAATNFLKPLPNVPKIFSVVAMTAPHIENFGREGLILLADCGVNPEPDVNDLATIAVETGKLAHHLLGRMPRVAMLSHSTHGSMNSASAQKMQAATVLAREMIAKQYLEIEIDGELQADVALDTAAAKIKLNDTRAQHSADVLIFPNLDASHIAYKLLQHLAGANCFGQLIMGLTRHAAQVPMTASVDMIAGTAALVACESIKYRQLNPDEEL
jgi:phosphotransacetylase